MLSRKEKLILKNLNDEYGSNSSCLISVDRLRYNLIGSKKIYATEVEKILVALEDQNFLETIKSNRQGEELYCVTLHLKGKHYLVENEKELRAFKLKIWLAVLGACVSFIVGRLLFVLF